MIYRPPLPARECSGLPQPCASGSTGTDRGGEPHHPLVHPRRVDARAVPHSLRNISEPGGRETVQETQDAKHWVGSVHSYNPAWRRWPRTGAGEDRL